MGAGPYIVVHLEDPPGSGRAACNGMLFESPYGIGHRGDVLWACTGCTVTQWQVGRWKREADEHQREVERLRAAALTVVAAYGNAPEDHWAAEQDALEEAVDALRAALDS